jgi:predicted transglutaminase-like cysteine proteinase
VFTPAVINQVNYEVNHAVVPCKETVQARCTSDFKPALYGDCKQYAAEKLRRLIAMGAEPDEFVIWITWVTTGNGREGHAVLVQKATDLVLDNLWPAVEPLKMKATHEGFEFVRPCPECGYAAIFAAKP